MGTLLAICALAGIVLHQSKSVLYLSLASLLIFFIYIINLAKNSIFFVMCCLPIVFTYCWFVLSFILLEFGAYTPELRITGEVTGGTARLAFFLFIFIESARFSFDKINFSEKSYKRERSNKLSFVLLLCILVQVSILAIYLIYGSALSNSIDRIQYRLTVAPKIFFQLVTVLVYISFFLGLERQATDRKSFRIFIDILFFINLALLAFGGEKFSLLFTTISLYIIPRFKNNVFIFKWSNIFKYITIVFFALLGILLLTINQYTQINDSANLLELATGLLLDRIAQQAQLNYFFDKLIFVDYVPTRSFLNFLVKEIFGLDDGFNSKGIQLLMNSATPSDLFALYSSTGVTFGDGFPAILYYYLGWYSIFFLAVFGVVFGASTALCFRVSMTGHVISGLILFYLIYNISLSAFLNGELFLILDFSVSKTISIICLLIAYLIYQLKESYRVIRQDNLKNVTC